MNRRIFLKRTLAAASTIPLMGLLGLSSPLEAAETGDGFKALVCVMLHGGADTFNMIIPTDADPYAAYEALRNEIAVPKEEILPFTHTNQHQLNEKNYGFRPEMSGMKGVFDASELAIIANVGTLVAPTTKEEAIAYIHNPVNLFAHNGQRDQWMYANAKDIETEGFGGKLANLFYPQGNPYFNITTSRNHVMQNGSLEEAILITTTEKDFKPIELSGFGEDAGGARLGSSYKYILDDNLGDTNKLKNLFIKKRLAEDKRDEALQGIFNSKTTFQNFEDNPLGNQLKTIAEILSVNEYFPGEKQRKMFVVVMGGWDTHQVDNRTQSKELSDGLASFNEAMKMIGLHSNVTTFTVSEFGRKVSSNGLGTDHGWGSQAFVMGGAVKGGDIYGKMPNFKSDSEDIWSSRVVPTTSVEEYLEPIFRWYGVSEGEMASILPNLGSFERKYMDFMG